MALRTLRIGEDDILRKKSKPVREINKKILELLDDMAETMRSKNGLGLAAPQVGVLKRVVIIELGDELFELINPEFAELSDEIQMVAEGCLSLPGQAGIVERPAYVKVKALNRNGEEIFVEGEELLARALCHELDHLDGILYIDKAIEMVDPNEDDDEEDEE